MIQQLMHLNWLSVLAAYIPYFILGALWFTVFFSKPYRVSLGKQNETPQKPALIFIIGPALCMLAITITSAVLINALGIQSMGGAIEFALVVGLGYVVANTVNIAINPNIPRPMLYSLISGSYHLVGILIVSVILVALN